jgi:hypothetical protein
MQTMKPGAPGADDDSDFLPDEFVLDDVPEPAPPEFIIFAGPSDAPPAFTPVEPPRPAFDRRVPFGIIGAVGLLGAIAVAWWARSGATGPSAHAAAPAQNVAVESPSAAAVVPAERTDVAEAKAAPAEASAASSAPSAPVAAAPAAAASAAAASAPGAGSGGSAVALSGMSADDAKHASQAALEKGHTADAIEAGERSVALDPTDAEAWLILGAAYDQRADFAKAKRCFKSCVDQATHGPRGECAALLR